MNLYKDMQKELDELVNITEIWDYLINHGICTEDELKMITDINGYNVETLEDVIYARTGYRNLEQLKGEYGDD